MTAVTLVYPFFSPRNDNSVFRFPPLGLGYLSAYLKQSDVSVDLVDCTFLNQEAALEKVMRSGPEIIGIYSMFSMKKKAIKLARLLKECCEFLVAGGPLPTSNPESFLEDFDAVVVGEGEQTMLELVSELDRGGDLSQVRGIAYKENGVINFTPPRAFIQNLESIPFPDRKLFDNQAYKDYYLKNFGYSMTSIMTSRGCPFNCEFCSRPVFGSKFRNRSPSNIVDEVEEVVKLGYDRIWFADDCFTLNRERLIEVCSEIIRRGIRIDWECLSRVDTIDGEVIEMMKMAGCVRIFYGIESGNNSVLKLMNKQITAGEARKAVTLTRQAGIEAGAFFMVGYPGETEHTILDTVNFASSLPLDYLSFTFPYPIPGTQLYERVKDKILIDDWEEPGNPRLIRHKLIYRSSFSERKLRFAIAKGTIQFNIRKYLKDLGYYIIGKTFEYPTNLIFKHIL